MLPLYSGLFYPDGRFPHRCSIYTNSAFQHIRLRAFLSWPSLGPRWKPVNGRVSIRSCGAHALLCLLVYLVQPLPGNCSNSSIHNLHNDVWTWNMQHEPQRSLFCRDLVNLVNLRPHLFRSIVQFESPPIWPSLTKIRNFVHNSKCFICVD